jgi:lysophospholipase L1-like esterase
MVVKHYHFYQQIVAGGIVTPTGGPDMSVPPPAISLPATRVVQSHPRVVQSHPKVLAPVKDHGSNKVLKDKTVVGVRSGKPILTLWGSSHLANHQLLGPDLESKLEARFQKVINLSKGGAKLTNDLTELIEKEIRTHPGPNQVYVILFGGNNLRKTTKPVLEVAKVVARFRKIVIEAQRAKIRILLCGTIPDPRPAVDSKLKLLDEALKDLDMGQGNNFLTLRGVMLDAHGQVRKDLFKPNGDIHLNAAGTRIVSQRIQNMINVMLPAPVPVQAPVPAPTVVSAPPVVSAPLVAVNAPVGVQAPAGVQAPVIVQHVVVVGQDQVESMETDEDEILAKLFFKKYGRELPEKEKEKEDEVDINFVIDLTDGPDEMEVSTSDVAPVVVVKKEPIEAEAETDKNPNAPTAANVAEARAERKAFKLFTKSAKIFAKKLEKKSPNPNPTPKKVRKIRIAEGVDQVIPEKEAPTNSADPNTTEAEFEKDLIGIYAGPIGKIVEDAAKDASMEDAPPKNVANNANDELMDDTPSKDDSTKDSSSKDV